MTDSDKDNAFLDLTRRVRKCTRCPRMSASARVLGQGCGPITADVMFIGEAPGRLGADASQLPFHGDQAGKNFETLLELVGLSRYDIFVTNAVLCNPKAVTGNNSTPTRLEIVNCSGFLREQIDLVDPKIIVPLGSVALGALHLISPHSVTLARGVRKAHSWAGRQLIPAYHPGQRAMIHRSFANQAADYQFIVEQLKRPGRFRPHARESRNARTQKIAEVADMILEEKTELSYFALHKLFFLAEVKCLEQTGRRLTGAYIIRQKDGPYCVELHAGRLRSLIPDLDVINHASAIRVRRSGQEPLFGDSRDRSLLTDRERQIVRECLERYQHMSDSKLKTVAYMTQPMRRILRRERREKLNLFNCPVLPPV